MKARVYIECDTKVLSKITQYMEGIYHLTVDVENTSVHPPRVVTPKKPLLRDQVMAALAPPTQPPPASPKNQPRRKRTNMKKAYEVARDGVAQGHVTAAALKTYFVEQGFAPSSTDGRLYDAVKRGTIMKIGRALYGLPTTKHERKETHEHA